jgi:hypothetical protein
MPARVDVAPEHGPHIIDVALGRLHDFVGAQRLVRDRPLGPVSCIHHQDSCVPRKAHVNSFRLEGGQERRQ